ncbi:MAG: hypothetical protein ABIO02_00960 [Patescibacteria group bacterium]
MLELKSFDTFFHHHHNNEAATHAIRDISSPLQAASDTGKLLLTEKPLNPDERSVVFAFSKELHREADELAAVLHNYPHTTFCTKDKDGSKIEFTSLNFQNAATLSIVDSLPDRIRTIKYTTPRKGKDGERHLEVTEERQEYSETNKVIGATSIKIVYDYLDVGQGHGNNQQRIELREVYIGELFHSYGHTVNYEGLLEIDNYGKLHTENKSVYGRGLTTYSYDEYGNIVKRE